MLRRPPRCTLTDTLFPSPSLVRSLAGLKDSFGVPMIVLGASYVGFGSLVHGAGLDVWLGLFSTFTGWALPGQIVVIELYSLGGSRSEEHTSELQSLMRISYAVFCL